MTNRTNRWIREKLDELKRGHCQICGNWSPRREMAHVQPTGLNGLGRGRKERYYDYKKHPESYKLLCHKCHKKLDGRR